MRFYMLNEGGICIRYKKEFSQHHFDKVFSQLGFTSKKIVGLKYQQKGSTVSAPTFSWFRFTGKELQLLYNDTKNSFLR